MRILVLNDDVTGSPAHIAQMLSKGFESIGHEVTILTSHRVEESPEILRKKGLVSLPISYRGSLRHYHCLFSPTVSSMFKKEIERIKPNIVHAHNIHHYLTYDILRIAREYTPNVFITMHDVFSFAFHRLNTKRFLDSGGRDTRLTVLDHLQAVSIQYNPIRNLWIRNILNKNVKKIIAVSAALERALHRHHITNTVMIHNGIDTESWTTDPSKIHAFKIDHALHDRKIVLFGGRLSLDKGTTPLLQTILKLRREIPNIILVVMGDQKRFDGCVRSAGIDEDLGNIIHCIGWLDKEDIKAAYAAADIVTVPSLCLDCFPQTNLEAMAAGKPVIGTIFGGTPEAVLDNVTGFTLDPRDTDRFAKKMHLLLTNENLRKTMGDAGRTRVEKHFSLSKQMDAYVDLFEGNLNLPNQM